jgi:hypothetical protein
MQQLDAAFKLVDGQVQAIGVLGEAIRRPRPKQAWWWAEPSGFSYPSYSSCVDRLRANRGRASAVPQAPVKSDGQRSTGGGTTEACKQRGRAAELDR